MAVREVTRHFMKLHLIPWKHQSAFQMSTCRMGAYIPAVVAERGGFYTKH